MRLLEDLQRSALLYFGGTFGDLTEAERVQIAAERISAGDYPANTDPRALAGRLWRQFDVPDPERWSACEPHAHRYFLSRAERAVLSGLEKSVASIPSVVPAVGTLPTDQLNAQAIPVENSAAYVIAFDSGLFDFTSTWSKVLASCFVFDEAAAIAFIDLCYCELILQSPAYLEFYNFDFGTRTQGEKLKLVLETFLMGHEYGHVALDHARRAMQPGMANGGRLAFTHAAELEADAYGLTAASAANNSMLGAYVTVAGLFSGLRILERGCELLEGRPGAQPTGGTHPPAQERRRALLELAPTLFDAAALAELYQFADQVDTRIQQWWEPIERALVGSRDHFAGDWPPRDQDAKRAAFKSFCASLR